MVLLLIILYFLKKAKSSLISDIIFIFSGFYFLKSVGGAQYLFWIVPFAFLNKEKMLYPYLFFASIYLVVGFVQSKYVPGIRGVGFMPLPAWFITGLWFKEKLLKK